MWTKSAESPRPFLSGRRIPRSNPRSTVATATEIYDYLRLLFARVGHTFCYKDGEEVRKDTLDEIAEKVLAMPEGCRFYVLYQLNLAPETSSPTAHHATAQSAQARCGKHARGAHQPA